MGMSASQMRFLSLTARKTNTEYQGQQINQARTALGNQSANYYNDMLTMKVPVPPVVQDFTKVVYKFQDGSYTNEITFIHAKPDGMYEVSYKSKYQDDFAIVKENSSVVTKISMTDAQGKKIYDAIDKHAEYAELKNTDANASAYITRLLNHILPPGNYETSYQDPVTLNRYQLTIYDGQGNPPPTGNLGDVDTQDFLSHPEYQALLEITKVIDIAENEELIQKMVDLLYDSRNSNPLNIDRVNTFGDEDLKTRFISLIETELDKALTMGYMVGGDVLRELGKLPAADTLATNPDLRRLADADFRKNDPYLSTLTDEQLQKLIEEEREFLKLLNSDELRNKYTDDMYSPGDPADNYNVDRVINSGKDGNPVYPDVEKMKDYNWLVRYVQNTTTGDWEAQFYHKTDLNGPYDNYRTFYDEFDNSVSGINYYKFFPDTEETKELKGIPARFERDGSGRFSAITLNPGTELEQTFSLATISQKDEVAFESAMQQYEYDKYEYENRVASINAKTKIVQEEDRSLEMKLKQLDTEQKAIQNEMESITKVIEKNVESSFKIFG